jgi:hypothetical protein
VLFTGHVKTLMAQNLNESHERVYATLTWDGAGAPLGRFLLIRKDKAVCAVRFTKVQRGHDAKPETTFNSGEESFSAEYDWYFQEDGSGDFTQPGVLSGHEQLARKPLKGIGRLAFQTGQIYVKCGTFDKLLWLYPTWVSFYGGSRRGDYGIELAPTKWTEIKEVNVHDPRLKWYRYDENRKPVDIPLDDL